MTFFDSDYLTIYIPPGKPYVHSLWHGHYSYEEAVNSFVQAQKAILYAGRSLYLSDVSLASPPCDRTLNYALQEGFAMMAEAGIHKIGSVFPHDSFSKLIAEQVITLSLPLQYRMFGTLAEAEQWLLAH